MRDFTEFKHDLGWKSDDLNDDYIENHEQGKQRFCLPLALSRAQT